jgi:hypothetical protein
LVESPVDVGHTKEHLEFNLKRLRLGIEEPSQALSLAWPTVDSLQLEFRVGSGRDNDNERKVLRSFFQVFFVLPTPSFPPERKFNEILSTSFLTDQVRP